MGEAGFVAVKNFIIENRHCSNSFCDFESNDCGWKTMESNSADYIFRRTSAGKTMGKIDHTSHSSYGYVEYLNSSSKDSETRFIGPRMSNLQKQCFSFWFLQAGGGSNPVGLTVLQYHIAEKHYDILWTKDRINHLANEWIRVQLSVVITDPVNLVFDVTKKGIL